MGAGKPAVTFATFEILTLNLKAARSSETASLHGVMTQNLEKFSLPSEGSTPLLLATCTYI
jgi:hypothetical protein